MWSVLFVSILYIGSSRKYQYIILAVHILYQCFPCYQPIFLVEANVECEPSRKPYGLQHEEYCDQYYLCDDGELLELLCEDGLVYDPKKEACDLPFAVDCGNRTKLRK